MRKIHIKEGEFTVIEVIREAVQEWATAAGAKSGIVIRELILGPSYVYNPRDGVSEFYNVELKFVADTIEVLVIGRVFDESQGNLATKAESDPLRERLEFIFQSFRFPGRDQDALGSQFLMDIRRGLHVYSRPGATRCLEMLLKQ